MLHFFHADLADRPNPEKSCMSTLGRSFRPANSLRWRSTVSVIVGGGRRRPTGAQAHGPAAVCAEAPWPGHQCASMRLELHELRIGGAELLVCSQVVRPQRSCGLTAFSASQPAAPPSVGPAQVAHGTMCKSAERNSGCKSSQGRWKQQAHGALAGWPELGKGPTGPVCPAPPPPTAPHGRRGRLGGAPDSGPTRLVGAQLATS